MSVNVLAMIHGISPQNVPTSYATEYAAFWSALTEAQPELSNLFKRAPIQVEWGNELPGEEGIPSGDLRADHQLTRAQNFVNDRVAYDNLIKDPHPNNHPMSLFRTGEADFPWFTPISRFAVAQLREQLITRGLGDVLYYVSPNGETQTRITVYAQILSQLDLYLDEPDVRIHLIGQSLGVTLSHDFLYGLFAPDHEPGFYKQGKKEDIERFMKWRDKVHKGELKLGSLTSTASQLSILTMRKQVMVDQLANKQLLKASDIGIKTSDRVKWNLFYDVDDVLAFGTRRLYDAPDAIQEIQVDAGDNPVIVHIKYWENKTVIMETAKLLLETAKAA
ncbi:MAG: hypothetical protein KME08_11545 [Aphanothece sp. CMT-3BRIN-NPC111]|jgi:hypothetical protein|nr:hypothetical protein [Aphanothece sp. CMT-3BRIN-NPC111]